MVADDGHLVPVDVEGASQRLPTGAWAVRTKPLIDVSSCELKSIEQMHTVSVPDEGYFDATNIAGFEGHCVPRPGQPGQQRQDFVAPRHVAVRVAGEHLGVLRLLDDDDVR